MKTKKYTWNEIQEALGNVDQEYLIHQDDLTEEILFPVNDSSDTLLNVIMTGDVAYVNKLDEHECGELEGLVNKWLRSKAVSAETTFDIDKAEAEQQEVIPLKAIGLA